MSIEFSSVVGLMRRALATFRPPPEMTVSEWADENRYLSAESSASPGKWYTSRVPYLKEPMDLVGVAGVKRISVMASAQVGKSSFVENVIAFLIDQDPCPILVVQPTINAVDMFSKERLSPMIRDTPKLTGKIKDAKSRDSGNTLHQKNFPGGYIAMVGSNAPTGLASRPVRALLCDEVDRFEATAGTEGDPVNLAVKRTTTFWNRILIFVSTPGDKGMSRIEDEFERGDQRRWWCPCPHCGEHQKLVWENVKWEGRDPNTAYYQCEHNGCVWDDNDRNNAVRRGEWRAEKPFNGDVSFHINQLYSPFAQMSEGVSDFLEAKDNPMKLKTWVNTFLGETWEDKGKRLDWSDLLSNKEKYETTVPEEVTLITASVDTQDDRFEVEFVGWGDDFRSWSLDYVVLWGDLSTPEPWENLREVLKQTFMHPLFGEMVPRMTAMDSGGHYTTDVYKFCKTMPRTVAIKGVGGKGKPMVMKPTKSNLGGYQVVPLGVDTIKEMVVSRLKVEKGTEGYCAFPEHYTDDYFKGITAEKQMTRFVKGFKVLEWEKVRSRNEPFDLRVYATAALEMLGVDLNSQRRSALRRLEQRDMAKKKDDKKPRKTQPKKASEWTSRWKHD